MADVIMADAIMADIYWVRDHSGQWFGFDQERFLSYHI